MARTKIITYQFVFPDGITKQFPVALELPTHKIVRAAETGIPSWTDLQFKQCPNCPLIPEDCPRCPVAVNLAPILEAFCHCVSSEQVEVTVRTEARDFCKCCPLQAGLSSLVGLIMATSGCPVLDRLRPMVFTHLPFSNAKETTLRAIATHLLSQCVRVRQGRTPDWEFKDLVQTYDQVRVVNKALAERFRSVCAKDASINAMVLLDTFAGLASFALAKEWWKDIEPLFAPCAETQTHALVGSRSAGDG